MSYASDMADEISVRQLRNHTADVLRRGLVRADAGLRDALAEALPDTVDDL
jgi:hypothetical protein